MLFAPAYKASSCASRGISVRPALSRTRDRGIMMRAVAIRRTSSSGSTGGSDASGVPSTRASALIGTLSGCGSSVAGLRVDRLPAVGRASPVEGVPPQLILPLFSLKPGEATMIETPEGFTVAVLAAIEEPKPEQDALAYGQMRDALIRAVGDDIERTYANAVRAGAKVTVTPGAVDRVAEP